MKRLVFICLGLVLGAFPVRAATEDAVVRVSAGSEQGTGSVVCLTSDNSAVVVTAWHVIEDSHENATIGFRGQQPLPGELFAHFEDSDLAFLMVRLPSGFRPTTLPVGSSSGLLAGDSAKAIGFPLMTSVPRQPATVVFQGLDEYEALLKFDCGVNDVVAGYSGGPLIIDGVLVGMIQRAKKTELTALSAEQISAFLKARELCQTSAVITINSNVATSITTKGGAPITGSVYAAYEPSLAGAQAEAVRKTLHQVLGEASRNQLAPTVSRLVGRADEFAVGDDDVDYSEDGQGKLIAKCRFEVNVPGLIRAAWTDGIASEIGGPRVLVAATIQKKDQSVLNRNWASAYMSTLFKEMRFDVVIENDLASATRPEVVALCLKNGIDYAAIASVIVEPVSGTGMATATASTHIRIIRVSDGAEFGSYNASITKRGGNEDNAMEIATRAIVGRKIYPATLDVIVDHVNQHNK